MSPFRTQQRHVVFTVLGMLMFVIALAVFALDIDPYLGWQDTGPRVASLMVTALASVAVALAPRWPGIALSIVWAVLLTVVVLDVPPSAVLVLTVVVGFACSAWGRTAVVWLSGLSIPAAAVVLFLAMDPTVVSNFAFSVGLQDVSASLYRARDWRTVAAVVAQSLLWLPWLTGLVVRFRTRSLSAEDAKAVVEAERDEAAEVARLREQQAQLARDVHDVVGHSLTVILAQAQAAQYLGEEQQVRASLETIATTAQTSLEDVRRVLASTSGDAAPAAAPAAEELHAMLDAVRASGRRVEFAEEGQPRPLPPELATVAHRVMQEMITNAVRHGAEHDPIMVERHWGWDLRLEVSNAIAASPEAAPVPEETRPLAVARGLFQPDVDLGVPVMPDVPRSAASGQGLQGMRRRLESVGGRLDVRVRSNPASHTVTAWIPLPGSVQGRPGAPAAGPTGGGSSRA